MDSTSCLQIAKLAFKLHTALAEDTVFIIYSNEKTRKRQFQGNVLVQQSFHSLPNGPEIIEVS